MTTKKPAHVQLCEYFAGCTRPAVGTTPHPILGAVPTCQQCADRFELPVTTY